MNIPNAVAAKHAIITDECRTNRGDSGAFEEAVNRLRQEYHVAAKNWGTDKGVKLHVILAVERPAKPAPPAPGAYDPAARLREAGEKLVIALENQMPTWEPGWHEELKLFKTALAAARKDQPRE